MQARKPAPFGRCRRGGAAVEFALVGLALMLFLGALVELGELGFSIAAQARGVQAAARAAAMDASNGVATSANGTPTEDSIATIRGYFNQYADPPLAPPNGTSGPQVSAEWCTNTGGSAPPALYLILTVSNTWVPPGFNMFSSGFTISLTTVATVMGTSGNAAVPCAAA